MRLLVRGSGVAGLVAARELLAGGFAVEVAEKGASIGAGASWLAGGMLAPWCEREGADERVLADGKDACDWWDVAVPGEVARRGTLVVAPPRDSGELFRFASRTSGYEWLDEDGIAELEPALADRFRKGLFFPREAHLDPRQALRALHRSLAAAGVVFHLNVPDDFSGSHDCVIDCTGSAAIGRLDGLRGVRGEMLHLKTEEVALSRPVRLLHPRHPIYVVPREHGRVMIGSTMIESAADGPPTVRSLMELLNSAFALHPAIGEASIIEINAGVRPAFANNYPQIVRKRRMFHINGLYRHGFLLAPAMARRMVGILTATRTKQAATGALA